MLSVFLLVDKYPTVSQFVAVIRSRPEQSGCHTMYCLFSSAFRPQFYSHIYSQVMIFIALIIARFCVEEAHKTTRLLGAIDDKIMR